MPSERFYRLPKEKQGAIWKASMKEFAAVPYEKVSINKIIREAGISRGSFYTYFEDKRDVLSFLLEDAANNWKEFCLQGLDKSKGDIFFTMESLLDHAIQFCKNNDLFSLHKNLIMYPDDALIECISEDVDLEKAVGEEFLEKIDRSKMRDSTVGEVIRLMKLCFIAMMACLAQYHKYPDKEEAIKSEYRKALSIFRYGAYKDSKKDQVEEN